MSGISYYTIRLANEMASAYQVAVITMRRMLPARFYPGRKRVGARLTDISTVPAVDLYDGVDWYWIPSILRAINLLRKHRPDHMVFQWWTATVLHTYLLLAIIGRSLGARVIVEFHEVLDTGEARVPLVNSYVRAVAPALMRLAHGFVIHSEFDRAPIEARYRIGTRPVAVIPLGPFDHHVLRAGGPTRRDAPDGVCNLVFFGVIRPFKGVEDLIAAFDAIPATEISDYWLTVVGETWEGWTLPGELIKRSRYFDRITFVNRYLSDKELSGFLAGADAVVLPYHRSSASGPVHTTMSLGLPLVVSSVGGLVEAASAYAGAIFVPPRDPGALLEALRTVCRLRGRRYIDPHSWQATVEGYRALLASV